MVSALLKASQSAGLLKGSWRHASARAVSSTTNGCRVRALERNWFPGREFPPYLPDDMLGNYGYDPLGLGKDPANLARFRECEVIHGRWAMLGVAGSVAVEVLGQGYWYTAPNWVLEGEKATYLGRPVPFDIVTLGVIELLLVGGAEAMRGMETDPEKRLYPGGVFDPAGMSRGDDLETLKLKELKNGRLAMLAWLGFVAQYYATGDGIVANWLAHVKDPIGANFATNGVSLPFL